MRDVKDGLPDARTTALTERQRKMLVHLRRRATSTQRLVRRAAIVLAAVEGKNNQQIANELRLNRETVRLWRRAWLEGAERLATAEEAEEKVLRRSIEEVLADGHAREPPLGSPRSRSVG